MLEDEDEWEDLQEDDDDWLLRENRRLKEEVWSLQDRVRELEVESNRRAALACDLAMTSDRMKLELIIGGALSAPREKKD